MSVSGSSRRQVTITVKVIGPTRPASILIPSPISVSDLRILVAAERRLPADRLKLVLKGNTLSHDDDGDGAILRLEDGDSLIVAVMPTPPAKHLREELDDDDDEDDDLKFKLPASTSWWKTRIFNFLQRKLRLPDILLMAIFSISLKAWVAISLWFALAPVAHKWGIGPIYILGTGFLLILLNLGKRQQGDVSAYSVFNEDFRELPGTLNADRLDRDIRAGQF